MSRAPLSILVSGHGHRLECGRCFNCNGLEYMSYTGGFDSPGFLPLDCRWLVLGPSLLSWMPIQSRHCCEESGRVFVWIVTAATVAKVVEGCVYLRRRYYAILSCFGRRVRALHSAPLLSLSSLSSNTMTINNLIRPRGGQGIQAWTLFLLPRWSETSVSAVSSRLKCRKHEVRFPVNMLQPS